MSAAISVTAFNLPAEPDTLQRFRDAGIDRVIFSIASEDKDKTLATLDKLAAAMRQVGEISTVPDTFSWSGCVRAVVLRWQPRWTRRGKAAKAGLSETLAKICGKHFRYAWR